MIGLDTNIVTRYLVNDDPDQAQRARALIDRTAVFVPKTVMLETEWVLRSVYRLPRDEIDHLLSTFAGLPTVTIEAAAEVGTALRWFAEGADFADALHLASAGETSAFASFDGAFNTTAERLGLPVYTP